MRTTILATLVAALAACSLGACDVDDLVAPPPWKDNTASVTGAPAVQENSAAKAPECPAPHPEHCKPGYIRAIAEDVSTVLCQHQAGCPFSSQPCVYGRAIGNPETVVLCLDE